MIKVRNLGRKSLEEVQNKLAMMGLSLASDEQLLKQLSVTFRRRR